MYTTAEAAATLGVSESHIRKRLIAGQDGLKPPLGHKAPKGKRLVWALTEADLATIEAEEKGEGQPTDYNALVTHWVEAQRNGTHTGKPMSPKAIEANSYGLNKLWQWSGLAPFLGNLNPATLELALAGSPPDTATRCHFTQRDLAHKAYRSFGLFLIRRKLKPQSILDEATRLKPRRGLPIEYVELETKDIERLLVANATWTAGRSARVRALTHLAIGLMAWAGLRATEVTGLKLSDIDPMARTIRVFGKGNKVRHVGLPDRLAQALQDWVLNHRGDFKNPLILLNEQTGQRLCPTYLGLALTRLGKKARIKAHPHALRHYHARALEDRGVSIDHIRQLLGHASVETTMVYLSRKASGAVKAAAALEF